MPAFGSARGPRDCAAFSANGDFASVATGHELKVTIVDAGNEASAASMPLPFRTRGECQAVFSADSKLLAVEITPSGQHVDGMYFALLNVAEKQWARPTPILVRVAPDSIGRAVGFLGSEHKLLTISDSRYFESENRTTAFAVVIEPFEPKAATNAFSVSGREMNVTNMAVDLANDRIWLADDRDERECKLRSTRLESAAANAGKLQGSDCGRTEMIAAVGGHSVLQLSRLGNGFALAANDAVTAGVVRAELKPARSSDSYWLDGKYSVSPNGQWLGLGLRTIHRPRGIGAVRLSYGIVVLDTATLRVVSNSELASVPLDFKLGEVRGQVVLAIASERGWTRMPLANAAPQAQPVRVATQ